MIRLSPARSKTLVGRILPISPPIADALNRRRARRDPESPLVFHRDGITIRRWRTAWRTACQAAGVPTRFLHDCRRTAARNLIRANVPERVAMLLTGHKSRAIFDRYNIIHEQELLDARDQLVAYLAQQAQAGPARPRPHPAGPAAPRTASPLRLVRRGHRVRAHGAPRPRRVGRGRQWPDTARLCAAAHARATDTTRPAIVAHAATGRADAAEHEHAPGPAAGACRKAGCHSPAQGHTRGPRRGADPLTHPSPHARGRTRAPPALPRLPSPHRADRPRRPPAQAGVCRRHDLTRLRGTPPTVTTRARLAGSIGRDAREVAVDRIDQGQPGRRVRRSSACAMIAPDPSTPAWSAECPGASRSGWSSRAGQSTAPRLQDDLAQRGRPLASVDFVIHAVPS